jgi:hypothetical protein
LREYRCVENGRQETVPRQSIQAVAHQSLVSTTACASSRRAAAMYCPLAL